MGCASVSMCHRNSVLCDFSAAPFCILKTLCKCNNRFSVKVDISCELCIDLYSENGSQNFVLQTMFSDLSSDLIYIVQECTVLDLHLIFF